ncbi:MAG TPA: hypothetical protein PKZ77_02635 [Pseudomonadales bacterium]|nr:hypothetical protein [Pseudomonadales bacterium]
MLTLRTAQPAVNRGDGRGEDEEYLAGARYTGKRNPTQDRTSMLAETCYVPLSGLDLAPAALMALPPR